MHLIGLVLLIVVLFVVIRKVIYELGIIDVKPTYEAPRSSESSSSDSDVIDVDPVMEDDASKK